MSFLLLSQHCILEASYQLWYEYTCCVYENAPLADNLTPKYNEMNQQHQ